MLLQYWAGVISSETIKQYDHIDEWGLYWLDRAVEAAVLGNSLIILEVPKGELLNDLSEPDAVIDDPLMFECFFDGQ